MLNPFSTSKEEQQYSHRWHFMWIPSHVSTEGPFVLTDTDCVYYSFHVYRGYESVCVGVCVIAWGVSWKTLQHLLVFFFCSRVLSLVLSNVFNMIWYIPQQVHYPDVERVEWINKVRLMTSLPLQTNHSVILFHHSLYLYLRSITCWNLMWHLLIYLGGNNGYTSLT